MALIEHKEKVAAELGRRFEGAKITTADSILIRQGNLITKIPIQRCAEEVFILRKFKDLGIPTVGIRETGEVETSEGKLPYYTMAEVKNSIDLIIQGDAFLNKNYYSFLRNIFISLRTISFKGFGAIAITNSGVQTEYQSERNFFASVIRRAEDRGYWSPSEIEKLREDIQTLEDSDRGILVHTDILNNVLVQNNGLKFYLIDPQTIISSANEYWDLSYYLVYANGFGCTKGLKSFLKSFKIANWNKFFVTTEVNAYERATFYAKYDQSKLPGILAFIRKLKQNRILVGNESLPREDLSV